MSTLVANSVFGVGRAAKQHARARWADDLWAPAGAQQFVRAPTAISKHPAARWLSLVTVEKPVIEEPPPKESARLSRIGDRYPGRHDRLRPGVEGHDHLSHRPRHLRNDHPEHRHGGQPDSRQRGRPE